MVASGLKPAGIGPSFLRSAEASRAFPRAAVADAVRLPMVAAGGIADGRTIAAALALGAHGAQVGTAFLACDESNAAPGHRAALFGPGRHDTLLTRGFSGRLARGLRNRLASLLSRPCPHLSRPVQSQSAVASLRREAIARDRVDLISLWAGQSTPLLRWHSPGGGPVRRARARDD